MKKLLLLIVLSFSFFTSKAQLYDFGIGFRGALSSSLGLSVKTFIDRDAALEFYLHRQEQRFYRLTSLYEHHFDLDNNNMHAFVGGGLTVSYVDDDKLTGKAGVGIDGIIGVEYVSDWMPVSIGIDYKPGFNVVKVGNTKTYLWSEIGMTLRLAF